MRYFTFVLMAFFPLVTLCPTAVGQAAVEYGLGAGRAATTTAPARKLGTSLSDLFGTATKAAQPDQAANETAPSALGPAAPNPTDPSDQSERAIAATKKMAAEPELTPATQEPTQPPPAPPAPVYEDPKQIQAGIGYDEMVRRFGPPSMSFTTGPGTSTLVYSSGATRSQVEVEDGKVVAPRRAASE